MNGYVGLLMDVEEQIKEMALQSEDLKKKDPLNQNTGQEAIARLENLLQTTEKHLTIIQK